MQSLFHHPHVCSINAANTEFVHTYKEKYWWQKKSEQEDKEFCTGMQWGKDILCVVLVDCSEIWASGCGEDEGAP